MNPESFTVLDFSGQLISGKEINERMRTTDASYNTRPFGRKILVYAKSFTSVCAVLDLNDYIIVVDTFYLESLRDISQESAHIQYIKSQSDAFSSFPPKPFSPISKTYIKVIANVIIVQYPQQYSQAGNVRGYFGINNNGDFIFSAKKIMLFSERPILKQESESVTKILVRSWESTKATAYVPAAYVTFTGSNPCERDAFGAQEQAIMNEWVVKQISSLHIKIQNIVSLNTSEMKSKIWELDKLFLEYIRIKSFYKFLTSPNQQVELNNTFSELRKSVEDNKTYIQSPREVLVNSKNYLLIPLIIDDVIYYTIPPSSLKVLPMFSGGQGMIGTVFVKDIPNSRNYIMSLDVQHNYEKSDIAELNKILIEKLGSRNIHKVDTLIFHNSFSMNKQPLRIPSSQIEGKAYVISRNIYRLEVDLGAINQSETLINFFKPQNNTKIKLRYNHGDVGTPNLFEFDIVYALSISDSLIECISNDSYSTGCFYTKILGDEIVDYVEIESNLMHSLSKGSDKYFLDHQDVYLKIYCGGNLSEEIGPIRLGASGTEGSRRLIYFRQNEGDCRFEISGTSFYQSGTTQFKMIPFSTASKVIVIGEGRYGH